MNDSFIHSLLINNYNEDVDADDDDDDTCLCCHLSCKWSKLYAIITMAMTPDVFFMGL